jgi:hypothetical protein
MLCTANHTLAQGNLLAQIISFRFVFGSTLAVLGVKLNATCLLGRQALHHLSHSTSLANNFLKSQ